MAHWQPEAEPESSSLPVAVRVVPYADANVLALRLAHTTCDALRAHHEKSHQCYDLIRHCASLIGQCVLQPVVVPGRGWGHPVGASGHWQTNLKKDNEEGGAPGSPSLSPFTVTRWPHLDSEWDASGLHLTPHWHSSQLESHTSPVQESEFTPHHKTSLSKSHCTTQHPATLAPHRASESTGRPPPPPTVTQQLAQRTRQGCPVRRPESTLG